MPHFALTPFPNTVKTYIRKNFVKRGNPLDLTLDEIMRSNRNGNQK